MTTQTITHALSLDRISSIRLPKLNWKAFLLIGFCIVLSLSVLYVFQINRMMRSGYVIKSYQDQVNQLIKENKNLEINLAQISYLDNIKAQTQELNFQKVQKIKYIQVLESSLASR